MRNNVAEEKRNSWVRFTSFITTMIVVFTTTLILVIPSANNDKLIEHLGSFGNKSELRTKETGAECSNNKCSVAGVEFINNSSYLNTRLNRTSASKELFQDISNEFLNLGFFGPEISKLRNVKFLDVFDGDKNTNGHYFQGKNQIEINLKSIIKRNLNLFTPEQLNDNDYYLIIKRTITNSAMSTLKHEYFHHIDSIYSHEPSEGDRILSVKLQNPVENSDLFMDNFRSERKTNMFFTDIRENGSFSECSSSITKQNYKDSVISAMNGTLKFYDGHNVIDPTESLVGERLTKILEKIGERNHSIAPYSYQKPPHTPNIQFQKLIDNVVKQPSYYLGISEQFARTFNWLTMPPTWGKINNGTMYSYSLLFREALCSMWASVYEKKVLYNSLLKIMNYGTSISNISYQSTSKGNFNIQGYIPNSWFVDKDQQLIKDNVIKFIKKDGSVIVRKIYSPWKIKHGSYTSFHKNIYNWNTNKMIPSSLTNPFPETRLINEWMQEGKVDRVHKLDPSVAYFTENLNTKELKGEFSVWINGHQLTSRREVLSTVDFDGTGTNQYMNENGKKEWTTSDSFFKEHARHLYKIVNGHEYVFDTNYYKNNLPYWDQNKNKLIIK